MVLEALSPRNLVVMDMKSGSLTIALGATEYKRYPKDEKPTKDNTTIGVSWEHGIYLGSTLSTTNFKAYKREYGTPEKIEDIYDYRAKLKQKFYFYQDMSRMMMCQRSCRMTSFTRCMRISERLKKTVFTTGWKMESTMRALRKDR